MSSRISNATVDTLRACGAGLFLLVAACSSSSDDGGVEGAEPLECLMPGQSDFKPTCTIEKNAGPDGTVLTVRAPDGEFRRLLIVRDGRGVIAADGAEEAEVKPAGVEKIDVSIGDIVWRLPATVKE